MAKETSSELFCCTEAALEKKAEELVVLDLRGLSDVTDYFVICHGTSDRQVVAIADSIGDKLKRDCDLLPNSVEGRRSGEWVLMDYIDFVVHIFVEERRDFYRLERLWGDAAQIDPSDLSNDATGDAPRKARRSPTG